MDLSNFTKSVFTLFISTFLLPTAEANPKFGKLFKGTSRSAAAVARETTMADPEEETSWWLITVIVLVVVILICCGLAMIKRKQDREAV